MSTQKDMFTRTLDETSDAFFDAVRNGLKLQEEVSRRYATLFENVTPDRVKTPGVATLMEEQVEAMKKLTKESFDTWEKNTEKCLDLVTEGARLADGVATQRDAEPMKAFWEKSMNAFRDNVETTAKLSQDLMQGCLKMAVRQAEAKDKPRAKATK